MVAFLVCYIGIVSEEVEVGARVKDGVIIA
jgi:hypothetical protein